MQSIFAPQFGQYLFPYGSRLSNSWHREHSPPSSHLPWRTGCASTVGASCVARIISSMSSCGSCVSSSSSHALYSALRLIRSFIAALPFFLRRLRGPTKTIIDCVQTIEFTATTVIHPMLTVPAVALRGGRLVEAMLVAVLPAPHINLMLHPLYNIGGDATYAHDYRYKAYIGQNFSPHFRCLRWALCPASRLNIFSHRYYSPYTVRTSPARTRQTLYNPTRAACQRAPHVRGQ